MPWTLIAQWVCAHQDVDLSLEARGGHGGAASRHRRSDIRLTHGSEPLMCIALFCYSYISSYACTFAQGP